VTLLKRNLISAYLSVLLFSFAETNGFVLMIRFLWDDQGTTKRKTMSF